MQGKFGNEPMSVEDILEASGNKNQFRNATVEELNECLEHTTGSIRLMFIGLIKQKINQCRKMNDKYKNVCYNKSTKHLRKDVCYVESDFAFRPAFAYTF